MCEATETVKCSAEEFTTTWRKYDADNNGYIEGDELTSFLKDLNKKDKTMDIKKLLDKYDKNRDNKIDMNELAAVLEPEENFLFLIRNEAAPNSVQFKAIWTKYDTDCSGYIESGELKNFLRDAYEQSGKKLSPAKLDEYSDLVLKLFDRDGNNKLDFNEMIKLLPLASNDLCQFDFSEANYQTIFARYDKDRNNTIEDAELDNLLADLLENKDGKKAPPPTIAEYKAKVLKHCDKNNDGKIDSNELKLVLRLK